MLHHGAHFFLDILQLIITACLSNSEHKIESSCLAVNIIDGSRHCFISCTRLQLSTERKFLLQMNDGGCFGTNKSYDSEMVRCKFMRNMCSLENFIIMSMENPFQDVS